MLGGRMVWVRMSRGRFVGGRNVKVPIKVDSKVFPTSHFSKEMPRQQGTLQHKKDFDSKNIVTTY
jgi:hypothetical protein